MEGADDHGEIVPEMFAPVVYPAEIVCDPAGTAMVAYKIPCTLMTLKLEEVPSTLTLETTFDPDCSGMSRLILATNPVTLNDSVFELNVGLVIVTPLRALQN